MLNTTPYNFYGSQIYVLVAPPSTSNRKSTQYSNWQCTNTSTDQNKNSGKPRAFKTWPKQEKRKTLTKQEVKHENTISTWLTIMVIKYLTIFKCIQNYQIQNLTETTFVEILGRDKSCQPNAYCTQPAVTCFMSTAW